MYAKLAMRCRATTLSDAYFLVVDTLPKGDSDFKFLCCGEPCSRRGCDNMFFDRNLYWLCSQFDLPVARGAEAVGVLREELCADGENPTENDFNFFSLNNVASYV
jgi:hypothetical protein